MGSQLRLEFLHAEGLGQQRDEGVALDEILRGLVGAASGQQDGQGWTEGAQAGQRPMPGTISSVSRAPSTSVPLLQASKQNSMLSGTTPESSPIKRTTSVTLRPSACPSQISTTLWVIDISCIARLRLQLESKKAMIGERR